MPRGKPATECRPRSKPRRERTQECRVTPTRGVLGSGLRFSSMVAGLMKSADFVKVQTHWTRPERLAPRTYSREYSGLGRFFTVTAQALDVDLLKPIDDFIPGIMFPDPSLRFLLLRKRELGMV